MKKYKTALILLILIITISCLTFLLIRKENKATITYLFKGNSLEIIETNNSDNDIILYPDNFSIYREKYNDTLQISEIKNGKSFKNKTQYIQDNSIDIKSLPPDRKEYVFYWTKITGLNIKKQNQLFKTIIQNNPEKKSLRSWDSVNKSWRPWDFNKYPFYYNIEPKRKIKIIYNTNKPLEKGKYKIFLDTIGREEYKNIVKHNDKISILNTNSIKDIPMEFEVN